MFENAQHKTGDDECALVAGSDRDATVATGPMKGQYPHIRIIGLPVNAEGDHQAATAAPGVSLLLTR